MRVEGRGWRVEGGGWRVEGSRRGVRVVELRVWGFFSEGSGILVSPYLKRHLILLRALCHGTPHKAEFRGFLGSGLPEPETLNPKP